MGNFSKEILDELDIEAYLDREAIDYKVAQGSSGTQLNLRVCPFCGGDKWKVYINSATGLGNCFSGSCEKKFNKFSFIRAYSGLSGKDLNDHIESVGEEIGWRPPRKSVAVNNKVGEVKLPFSYEIPIKGKNLKYLENRGITIEMCEYFKLRYCHKGYYEYTNYDGLDKRMFFDSRIVIPIYDIDGTLVTFQGRDITGTSDRKYLFPPGLPSTGEHLYNSMNVHNTHRIVIGEGVFDVIAIKMALDEDVSLRDVVPIGSFGKHLSVNQYSKFSDLKARGVTEVTLMWDGEKQATDDAVKAGMKLVGMGFKVRIAMLPAGKDPNEVLPEVVRDAYYKAIPLTKQSAVRIMMSFR